MHCMNGEADNSHFVSMHVYMHLAFKELMWCRLSISKGVNTNLQYMYMYLEKTNSLETDPHLGVTTESVRFK